MSFIFIKYILPFNKAMALFTVSAGGESMAFFKNVQISPKCNNLIVNPILLNGH